MSWKRRLDKETAWRVERLEDELKQARWTIIWLMPEDIQKLLHSFWDCETREETYAWEHDIVSKIVDMAEPIPEYIGSWLGDRAVCPLCGGGATSTFHRGFSLREGLRRHLIGWGNTQQCNVMRAVMGLARSYWNQQFAEQEAAEYEARQQLLKARRQTETLFLVKPHEPPLLIDEYLYRTESRNEEELQWAEERLANIGFEIRTDGRVKSYVRDHGNRIVYADPRAKGRIEFYVFNKTPSGKPSRRRVGNTFYLLDTWKHDLVGKYLSRLNGK